MGNCASSRQGKSEADAKGRPRLEKAPGSTTTFDADVCLTDKFAEWKKEESSAAELFNSCLSVVLPIVKEEVGKQLIQLNESGGLDVAGGYKLKVVPRTGDAKRKLTPDELIKTLQVEIKTCRVRTKVSTPRSRPSHNGHLSTYPLTRSLALALTLVLTLALSLALTRA